MALYDWQRDIVPYFAAKFAEAEQKFTNEQIEYLHQYYSMNKYPFPVELKAIANQWNVDDFDYQMSLSDWFFGRRMAEEELEERRYQGRIASA